MPPSLMMPTFFPLSAAAASSTAVICGTPVPATIRVVQIEPGPMPTLIASAPASAKAFAPAAVATLPAITCMPLNVFLMAFKESITGFVCPCALSRQIMSTPARCNAATRSSVSFVIPTPAPTSSLPKESFTAFGLLFNFKISPKVTSPINLPALFTTGNFSILFFLKMSSAFLRSVPSGAVIRFSLVIMLLTFSLKLVSNRRSRLVSIPNNFWLASTIGIPPILFSFINRIASPMVASGLSVNGSSISPFSLRLTFLTWSAWWSILIFLCSMPSPPSLAKAIASAASVTVSIAALNMGTFKVMVLVSLAVISTSRGNTSE